MHAAHLSHVPMLSLLSHLHAHCSHAHPSPELHPCPRAPRAGTARDLRPPASQTSRGRCQGPRAAAVEKQPRGTALQCEFGSLCRPSAV